jgi:hypothetical protein
MMCHVPNAHSHFNYTLLFSQGTYTPCSFFDSVEFSRTLLDDHLLEPGYHPALLGLAREEKGDLNFHFDHDLMALGGLV